MNSALYAASSDAPGDFLNAYSDFQKAEKQEAGGDVRGALNSYRDTLKILDHITATAPNWNPSIVDYRRKRTTEAISKLAGRVGGSGLPLQPQPTLRRPESPGNLQAEFRTSCRCPMKRRR